MFLRQEIELMINLVHLVRITLRDLRNVISGAVALSDSLDEALECVGSGKIPPSWAAVSWPSSNLAIWAQVRLLISPQSGTIFTAIV